MHEDTRKVYRVGGLIVNEKDETVLVDGSPIQLPPLGYTVLTTLLARPRTALDSEELFGGPRDKAVIHNTIAKLRTALSTYGALIKTHRAKGYSLEADVEVQVVGMTRYASTRFEKDKPVGGLPGFIFEKPMYSDADKEVWRVTQPFSERTGAMIIPLSDAGRDQLQNARYIHEILEKSPSRSAALPMLPLTTDASPLSLAVQTAGRPVKEFSQHEIEGFSLALKLEILASLADAVSRFHKVEIVHGNIEPGSVYIELNNQQVSLKLGDLFYARSVSDQQNKPAGLPNSVSGNGFSLQLPQSTTSVAPEVRSGDAPTMASDIYSIGVFAYQLLTNSFDLPPGPDWLKDIDDVVLRDDIGAMAQRAPDQRPGSAARIASAFRNFGERSAQREAEERLLRELEEKKLEIQRFRAQRPWILAAVSTFVIGGLSAGWLALVATDARAEVSRARIEAVQQRDAAMEARDFLAGFLSDADPRRDDSLAPLTVEAAVDKAVVSVMAGEIENPQTALQVSTALISVLWGGREYEQSLEMIDWQIKLADAHLDTMDEVAVIARLERAEKTQLLGLTDEANDWLAAANDRFDGLVDPSPKARFEFALFKGKTLNYQTKYEEALTFLEAAIAEDDPNEHTIELRVIAHIEYAQSLLRSRGAELAAAHIEKMEKEGPHPSEAGVKSLETLFLELKAIVFLDLGKLEEARSALETAGDIVRQDFAGTEREADILGRIADIENRKGKFREALDAYSKAAQYTCDAQGPDALLCHWFSAEAAIQNHRLGHSSEAVVGLAEHIPPVAVQYPSAGSVFSYHLSQALVDAGEMERARKAFDQIDVTVAGNVRSDGDWETRVRLLGLVLNGDVAGLKEEMTSEPEAFDSLRPGEKAWFRDRV